jgi:hypothetical protein
MAKAAVLVGIDHYATAPLAGCVADAQRMAKLLSNDENGDPNFTCRTVVSEPTLSKMANAVPQVTTSALRAQVEALFKRKVDVALFFFAGHGTADNLGGYLVTQDAKRYADGLSMNDVLNMANASPAQERVIVLDCCQSGVFGQTPALNNAIELREGVSILAACRDNEVALEPGGGGLFTSLVAAALEGGAADVCGKVTVASVYAYADEVLGVFDQRPLFKAHVSKLVTLRNCQPIIPPGILRLLPSEQYFPTEGYQKPLDPSYEPTAEPKHEEHERIFGHLQKMRAARLVEPCPPHEHMYFAAMERGSCGLTLLGRFYWRRASSGKI